MSVVKVLKFTVYTRHPLAPLILDYDLHTCTYTREKERERERERERPLLFKITFSHKVIMSLQEM